MKSITRRHVLLFIVFYVLCNILRIIVKTDSITFIKSKNKKKPLGQENLLQKKKKNSNIYSTLQGSIIINTNNKTEEEEDINNTNNNTNNNDVVLKCLNWGELDHIPQIKSTKLDGNTIRKFKSYYRKKSLGNSLSEYWAVRTIAKFGGYEYIGQQQPFGKGTWMEYLPNYIPAASTTTKQYQQYQKDIFDTICNHCTSYFYFHRGECSNGWGNMVSIIRNDTRNAIIQYSKLNASNEENKLIFNFFQPNDWIIYNRCCIFYHEKYSAGVLRTYDSIPTNGTFNVYIMSASNTVSKKKEDPYKFCNIFIQDSMNYIKKRNKAILNITILPLSTMYVDFARLVFAPNVLITNTGSSWALWSAIMSNNNTVITHIPSMNMTISNIPNASNVQILHTIPTIKHPLYHKDNAIAIGLQPYQQFSNTTKARNAVLQYYREA